jgi:hypothetical protein
MSVHNWWAKLCCIILLVALVVYRLLPGPTETVFIVEPVDASIFDRVVFRGFSKKEAAMMSKALLPKFTRRCGQAFNRAGLQSPWQMAWESGIVIEYFGDLYLMEPEDLGLVHPETLESYKWEFGTGHVQAGAVPHVLYNTVLTTDGRPHIFIHDSAFIGESFWLGTLSLTDVFSHELIHAGGQPPMPGLLGPLRHDLAGFEYYDEIIEACR